MALVIYAALGVLALLFLFLIIRNWHRQRDFEGAGHVVPEDYD